jgi:hypothetical protein
MGSDLRILNRLQNGTPKESASTRFVIAVVKSRSGSAKETDCVRYRMLEEAAGIYGGEAGSGEDSVTTYQRRTPRNLSSSPGNSGVVNNHTCGYGQICKKAHIHTYTIIVITPLFHTLSVPHEHSGKSNWYDHCV